MFLFWQAHLNPRIPLPYLVAFMKLIFHRSSGTMAILRQFLYSLFTLQASISADYVKLASPWRLTFAGQDWLPAGFR